jgi:hypothetical protein
VTPRLDDLGTRCVVLQLAEARWFEVGVTEDAPGRIDEGDAVAEDRAERIGQGVGAGGSRPSCGDDPRLTLELIARLPVKAVAQPFAGDRDDEQHEYPDQRERSGEEALGEAHQRSPERGGAFSR